MSSRKFGLNLVIVMAIAALFTGFWALINRPVSAPDWPEQISGFSYSPFRLGQSPQKGQYPTEAELREDLEQLSKLTDSIRIYTVEGTQAEIPRLAEEFGLRVTLGVWISPDQERNEREIQKAIELANTSRSVVRVMVGNEALFREEITPEALIQYLDRVRAAVKVPVTTSEQWHIWKDHPELAKHVDLVAAHILPYWEFIPMKDAGQFVLDRARDLKHLFPRKPLLLSEVGWPSNGRMRGGADATQADQAIYLRTLVNKLNRQGYNYFVIEAYDQPWKASDEGSVGAYWGVFNAARQQKFNFTGPVVAIPQWRVLAVGSVVLALLSLTLLLIDGSALRQRGRTFLTFTAFLCGSVLVWIGYDYSQQYSTWFSLTVGFLLALGALGVFIVLLTEAHELAETVWNKRRREFLPVHSDEAYRPKVSVHVPCYNEPPEMVKQTLDALAALDYPDYEVLIIDNNTKDPAVWEPIKAHCELLGERFKFFHVSPLAGFKGGALNYLIPHTAKDAEVIAVIDSDYCVDRNWLKHMVPHFADPKIAVVQSPQDYRDQNESTFKKLCYSEYKGFFHIGMVTRNDRDAIIQHGTMTMTRRSVLEELGWADWCICEDAELGLRVFEKGYSAAYSHNSYGKGLMPDTFIDFKKQRFRWAYGAIQIIKRHTASLLRGKDTELTRGQRYHFLAGWLPWVADGMNIFFTVGALLWSAAMIIVPQRVDPPLLIFAIPPLALFFFKVGKIVFLYRRAVGVNMKDAFAAALAGLALSHTIAKAVLYGFFTTSIPFFRTPKNADSHGVLVALSEAREELFIMLLLWGAAAGIYLVQGLPSNDMRFWVAMLLVQSLPYVAALTMALLSSLPKPVDATEPAPAA
ncbi:glycosyltransferase [Pseudomonas huaxiensis]|uniref:glycosyltransferase n=1 Tax=Pseudomonas huaxiensis TaxID=2213017 RepID=UPI000DA65E34|nr:glycosyltransferase [Pseudomonas huaxiensis]